jgi:CCR4-NOT transcriptional regulation complex NOT5 subunit
MRQRALHNSVRFAVFFFCGVRCRSALPQPSDSDWDKPKPRHPIVGPASYPKSQPDVISAPGLFRKMDPEALFFAFYYQPDTYQQYLAAQVRARGQAFIIGP